MATYMIKKYVWSGHESFPCRMLWPIKGYDFVVGGNSFSNPYSVVLLGVGKNMVASIRYWLKAFMLTEHDECTEVAHYLFDKEKGKDRYIESLGTLWLLHYLIVVAQEATLYNILFLHYQKERKRFDKEQILAYVRRLMMENGRQAAYNANTVGKDFNVLIQNYVQPSKAKSHEDYSSLLADLNLVRQDSSDKSFVFNMDGKRPVPLEIFFYALLKQRGDSASMSYDALRRVGLIFCMTDIEVITMLRQISDLYSEYVQYSDIAGIRQLLFKENITIQPKDILNQYYNDATV